MREQGISESVPVHVTISIGGFGRAQKWERNGVALYIPAVFRIVEHSHAPLRLGKIGPSMSTHLEPGRIPRRILVRRTAQVSKLRIERGL